jgi:hypothetical protein
MLLNKNSFQNNQGGIFSNWKAGPLIDPFGISITTTTGFSASNCAGTEVKTRDTLQISTWKHIAVVFDGWSVPERDKEDASNETQIEALEKDCLQPILNLLPPEITTYSTIGHPIYETIVWAEAIDLYSVPLGTGMTFVTWIASKPGVGHGTKDYYGPVEDSFSPLYRENAVPPVLISKEYITEDNKNNPDPMTRNYDCDWQVIYNQLMQILQNLPKRV